MIKNVWFILLTVLLIILIICSIILIFLILRKKDTVIVKEIIIKENKPIVKNNDELPIYPKELPKYNDDNYQQIGILTSNETDKEPIILPLFGKKLYNRSDRWQYYTASDKNNMIRLPIKYENKDCEDDVGCRELYNGDNIIVDIYQGRLFTATIYKTKSPTYFASI